MLNGLKRLVFSVLTTVSTAYAKCRLASYGPGLRVNFPCAFGGSTHVGKNCHFNGLTVSGVGRLTIGDYFHSGSEILVLTGNHNYKRPTKLPYDEVDIPRDVIIGHYVWLGSRVILLPGVELGDGCVVQAGAVVGGKHPPNCVLGGNPAQVFGVRDEAATHELVAAGSYLQ